VADRFAAEGFSVVAPEILPEGMLQKLTPEMPDDLFNPEKRNEVQPKLRAALAPIMQPEYANDAIAKLKARVDYLLADKSVNGVIGVVGFCFGGTYAYHLASYDSRVQAAVPFYGEPPEEVEIPNVVCPVLAFYGEKDAGLMESLPKLKESMQKNGKKFDAVVYPNAGHAFFNDTNVRAYNREAAEDAWKKTLEFLRENLNKTKK
jgi:carboxymethylenebutenolidase